MRPATAPEVGHRAIADVAKYLTFYLGDEEYAIDILKVKEIIRMLRITRVPSAQHYVRGVINLRGQVIPVVDLRSRFGMAHSDTAAERCIVVVTAGGRSTGVIIDEVSEVVTMKAEDIEPVPDVSKEIDTGYLLGIGRSKEQIRLILDIERVIGVDVQVG